ncbi:MAG: M20 family metallopeptidase [Candidatus Saccharicenans sp.]|jgi:glutamate carboxypeptidase|nr:M20 family metallopeptidase [Candidatus Saccharicenans sp.]
MDFLRYFKSRQGEMVSRLKTLVQLESPTSDKKAVDKCSAAIISELSQAGVKIKKIPQNDIGDLFLAEYPAGNLKESDQPILILTHTDTVWPVGTLERMPFYLAGDRLYGPGALDMKAGVTSAVMALKTINSLGLELKRKVWLFINSAEETGHEEAHRQIVSLAKKAGAVLCLEPALPGGALKMERKGRLVVKLEASGRPAHASTPEKGVNAIEELIAQWLKVKKLKINGLTANLGLIGGGEKANVVPEKAWAIIDFRFWTSRDLTQIKSFLRELKAANRQARVKTSIVSFTPPMEFSPASRQLFARATALASSLGLKLEAGRSGGGSDASLASQAGVPVLDGLGPDGEGIHAVDEHLLLPSFIERTALLTKLLIEL